MDSPTREQLLRRIEELEAEVRQLKSRGSSKETDSLVELTNDLKDRLRFIQTLFDTIPNPVFYKNIDGVYLGCNQAFADLIIGLPLEKIIGCTLYDLPETIPKYLADLYFEQDQNLFNNPGVQVYETEVKCADGALREFLFYKSTYLDHGSEVAGLLGLMLDITDRKAAQKELEESEKRYRSMMESMTDAVHICSSDLTIEYMNPKMIEQVGFDATGKRCHEVLHHLPRRCSWCDFPKVVDGKTVDQEVKNQKDGRTYLVNSSPIRHTDGSILKMTIYRDITERKEIESELMLAKKIESTGVFAGGIAHDYSNLLLTILGNLLMVKQAEAVKSETPILSLIEEAEDAAKLASQLTRRLVAFTHGEALALDKCSIVECVERVVAQFPMGENYPISKLFEPDLGSVYLDVGLFTIALRSVLANAKEAMTAGGSITIALGNITITDQSPLFGSRRIEKVGDYVEVKISDNGPGIPNDILPRVFDPYCSSKTRGAQKGLGLGLSTSYSIIRKHLGYMRIANGKDSGTVVSIYLPTWNPQDSGDSPAIVAGIET